MTDEPDLSFGDQWQPDLTTFLGEGAFVRSLISLGVDRAPDPTVAVRFAGRWNHGAVDKVTVILAPAGARELAESLMEAADAADRDVRDYLSGKRRST
jgi:hypothetical protein